MSPRETTTRSQSRSTGSTTWRLMAATRNSPSQRAAEGEQCRGKKPIADVGVAGESDRGGQGEDGGRGGDQVPAPLRPAGRGTSISSFAVVSARASTPTASHSAQLTVRDTTIRCTRVLYSAAATRITSVAATPNRTGSR